MTEQGTKRRGCLFYIAIAAVTLIIFILLGAAVGWHYAKGLVNQLTDTLPMPLPQVQMSEGDLNDLRDRVETFSEAVRAGNPAEPLALTGDEVNALVANEKGLEFFHQHFYINIEGNQLKAQISIPADQLGLRPLQGRYINANGTFSVAVQNGSLLIVADTLEAKGKPFPGPLMREIHSKNLAANLNDDPRVHAALGKLKEIQVKDGKIIFLPK